MDLALKYNIETGFDIQFNESDFGIDNGLETYVIVAIFSDRRISTSELPDQESFKRGYWADQFSEIENDKIGSKIWTLLREKKTNNARKKWEDAILESLQIMIDDKIAKDIIVSSEYDIENRLNIFIKIIKPDNDEISFQLFWDAQELKIETK